MCLRRHIARMLVLAFFATAQTSSSVALPLYPQAPTHEELAANLAQWLRHADEPQNGEINIQVLEVVGAYAKPFLRDGEASF